MKIRNFLIVAALFAASMVFTSFSEHIAVDEASPAPPNEGWVRWDTPYRSLQNWTTQPAEERFWNHGNGAFSFKLRRDDARIDASGRPVAGGTRVELRWPDWPDQEAEHMIVADVMYEEGTVDTCIIQIKTNTGVGGGGHASIYLVVREGGNLHHGVNRTVIIENGYGIWHNIKAAYNPITGLARVWINNELKFYHIYPSGYGSVWYFKNGAYWARETSRVHFKNLSFWVNPVKESEEVINASRVEAARRAREVEARRAREREAREAQGQ